MDFSLYILSQTSKYYVKIVIILWYLIYIININEPNIKNKKIYIQTIHFNDANLEVAWLFLLD